MSRPPVFPAEQKMRIVLSILAGEITAADAARQFKVSEQSIGTWKRQFMEGGRAGLESNLAAVSVDVLETLVRNRLKSLPSRPIALNGFVPETGLAFDDKPP